MDPDASALVLLDAEVLGPQRLLWCPLRYRHGRPGEDAVIVAEWGPPVLLEDPPLPGPVVAVLRIWRSWLDLDLDMTVIGLQRAGYRVRFVNR